MIKRLLTCTCRVKGEDAAAPVLLLGALLAALGTASCSSTPRGLAHQATRPVAQIEPIAQDVATANFAAEVSIMGVGQTSVFELSPFGNGVSVTAQQYYLSGLGEKCRKASVSLNGISELFAVCEQSDGNWRYIAPLTQSYMRGNF